MLFDQFAGIVERHLPQFIPVMKKAKLFQIDNPENKAVWELNNDMVSNRIVDEFLFENFRLPFNTIALEPNKTTCQVLTNQNIDSNSIEFLTCTLYRSDHHPDIYSIANGTMTGFLSSENGKTDFKKLAFSNTRAWQGSKKEGLKEWSCYIEVTDQEIQIATDYWNKIQTNGLTNQDKFGFEECKKTLQSADVKYACKYAMLSTAIINSPTHFIVEESQTTEKSKKTKKDIERSDNKPKYIIMTPGEIRKRFIRSADNTDPESTNPVASHERRGHYRRLQSERFTNARGRIIWIASTWVGPSEAVIGKTRYKVLLDK